MMLTRECYVMKVAAAVGFAVFEAVAKVAAGILGGEGDVSG